MPSLPRGSAARARPRARAQARTRWRNSSRCRSRSPACEAKFSARRYARYRVYNILFDTVSCTQYTTLFDAYSEHIRRFLTLYRVPRRDRERERKRERGGGVHQGVDLDLQPARQNVALVYTRHVSNVPVYNAYRVKRPCMQYT